MTRLLPALLLAALASPAHAVLGEPLPAGRATVAAAAGLAVHERRAADGSSIREYVDASGVVCAVAWNSRLRPDLAALLGRHTADWHAGLAALPARRGIQRRVEVAHGDLVVQAGGRLQAFNGRAWLASRCGAGVRSDAVR